MTGSGDDASRGVVRVLVGGADEVAGAGFVLSADGLLVTCAHVVAAANSGPGRQVRIAFVETGAVTTAEAVPEYWSEREDVAILRTRSPVPEGVAVLTLRRAVGSAGEAFATFGFPAGHPEGLHGYGQVANLRDTSPRLQLRDATEVTRGFSGAPLVVDGRVVGMVADIAQRDQYGRLLDTAFAVPTETLRVVCRELQLEDECPFQGLEYFDIDDSRYFFGRSSVVSELVQAVTAPGNRCVAVFGPSGSGKSSVVRAGLLATLREGNRSGTRDWVFEVTRPAELSGPIADLLHAEHTVLVLDQFEEVFAFDAEQVQQRGTELLDLLGSERALTLVLVMRDDFYSQLAEQLPVLMRRWIAPSLRNIPATLAREDLEEIVRGPSAAAGLTLEPGLVELVVEEAEEASGSGQIRSTVLPLVEFALTWLWRQQDDGRLTVAAFRGIGGIAGGLTTWAERAYGNLPEPEQLTARRLITRLSRLGDESRGLPDRRQRRTLDDLSVVAQPDELRRVLDALVRDRLVVTSTDEQSGAQAVELIHDVLLREWKRLRDWLLEDRDFLNWRETLDQRVELWNLDGDVDDQDWFKGRELSQAEEWLRARQDEIAERGRAFIGQSVAARQRAIDRENELVEDAEREREEAQRQRQLASTREIMQRLRSDADQAIAMLRVDPTRALGAAIVAAAESIARLGDDPIDAVHVALFETARAAKERDVRVVGPHVVTDVAFAGSSGRFVVAGTDGTVRSCAVDGGSPDEVIGQLEAAVLALAAPGAGDVVLTGDADGSVRVWSAAPGVHAEPTVLSDDGVLAVGLDPVRGQTIAGCADGTLARWTIGSGPPERHQHTSYVATVACHPAGAGAVAGTGDGKILWWASDRGEPEEIGSLADVVTSVDISADGRLIAAASADGTISVTAIATGEVLSSFSASLAMVTSLAFGADGSALIAGTDDGAVGLWDPVGARIHPALPTGAAVRAVAVSPDCRTIAVAAGPRVHVIDWLPRRPAERPASPVRHRWDARGDQLAPAFHPGAGADGWTEPARKPAAIQAVRFTRGGAVVSAGIDQSLRFWRLDGAEDVHVPDAHQGGITALATSPTGFEVVVSGGRDDVLRLHSPSGAAMAEAFAGHTDDVMAVDFHPDGQMVVSGSRDGTVQLWRDDGTRLARYDGHGDEVLAVRVSPDGERVASAGLDGEVHLWATADPAKADVVARLSGRVWDLDFTAGGEALIAGADGGVVLIVDELGSAARSTRPLLGHTGAVRAVRCHPDGDLFVSASEDATVQLWSLRAGRVGHLLEGHVGPVYALDISADGRLAVTGGADGTVRLWRLGNWRTWLQEACDRLAGHPFLDGPAGSPGALARQASTVLSARSELVGDRPES